MAVYYLNVICVIEFFLIFWLNSFSSYEISTVYEKIELLDIFDYYIFIESILKIENFNRLEWSSIVSKIDNRTRINFITSNISDGICSILIKSSISDNSRLAQIYAQALEKAGEVSKSWECYRDINLHLNKKIFLHNTISNFDFLKLSSIPTELKIHPIFVIGFLFSGTDIVENILDNCMGSLSILNNDQLLGLKRNIEIKLLQLKKAFSQDSQITNPKDSIVSLTNTLKIRNECVQNINDYLQSNLFSHTGDNVNGIQYYIHNLDHIPDNYKLAPFLHLLFPDSPIIHVVNDPMDTILKCYQKSSKVVAADDTANSQWLFDLDDIVYHYKSYLKAMDLFLDNIPSNPLLHLPYPLFHHSNETLLSITIQSLLLYTLPKQTPTYPSVSDISDIIRYSQFMIDKETPPGYWLLYQSQLNDITLFLNHTLTYLFDNGYQLRFIKHLNWMADPLFNYIEYYSMLFNTSGTSIFNENISSWNRPNDITNQYTNITSTICSNISSQDFPAASSYTVTIANATTISDVTGNVNVSESFTLDDAHLLELGYYYHDMISSENLTKIRANYELLPLQHDNYMINDLLALAYSQIRTNKFTLAEKILTRLTTQIPNIWSASLGLSEILAATQRYQEAIDSYSSLPLLSLPLSLASYVYRQRAELYKQVSQYENAVEDYNRLLEIDPNDIETLQNRGTLYLGGKFLTKAYADFMKLYSLSPSQLSCYYIGLVESRRGHVENAVVHFDLALSYDPTMYQLHILKAHTLMEGGRDWKEAFLALEQAIRIDPSNAYSYTFRGLLYYNLGLSELALADIEKSLEISPSNNMQCVKMKAVALHSLGRLAAAMDVRTEIHLATADRFNWYSREMIAFWLIHLHDDFSTFNMFTGVRPGTRLMGWSQWTTSPDRDWDSVTSIIDTVPFKKIAKNRNGSLKVSKRGRKLLQMTASIGRWVQLDTMGFLPNIKQYRMFGLSVLEMAQAIRRHVAYIIQGKKKGWEIPHNTSSRARGEAEGGGVGGCMLDSSCESSPAHHSLGYRDLADIALKWRQLSEPSEVVIWFDCLPRNVSLDFAQVTHLVAGQSEVLRYFSYANKSMSSMKAALMTGDEVYTGDTVATSSRLHLNDQQRENITAATTYQDIYHAVNQSFWVKLAVRSTIRPREFLGGTDLVLKTIIPEGYAFAIRTPFESDRAQRFDEELNEAFQRYIDVLLLHLDKKSLKKKKKKNKKYLDLLNKHTLEIFYYWINLGATTRGTAAIGYALLYAALLASDRRMTGKMPENRQLDWEALLLAEPEAFFEAAQPWIDNVVPSTFPSDMMEGRVEKYDVRSVFRSPADIISGLSMLGTGTVETEDIFN